MWVKIIGSVLVVAAGAGLGFNLAGRLSERPRQVGQLIAGLTALGSYVNYAALPLTEALDRAAAGLNGPTGDFLRRAAAIMGRSGWLSPREALAEALAGDRRLALAPAEREIILQLGTNLGATGREEQQKYLAMVIEQLSRIELDALRLKDQNAKMYRYLGVCGGLAVAILLV